MEKDKTKKHENKMIEGFSMRDCVSQEVIDKMYSLHKRDRKSSTNSRNKDKKK